MVTALIPWRPQPSRLAAYDATIEWYQRNLPEVRVVSIDSDDEVFTLSRCRNLGVARADDDVVIINDADTLPELSPLLEAISAARVDGLVHLPYTDYRWLGGIGTAQFAEGRELSQCDYELVVGACSGVYVTTADTWWSHGGQDERFRGWGFEDAAWYLAHETLLDAPPQRHSGRVYAQHHVAEQRFGTQYEANERLMARYREASGNVELMRQVVFEDSMAERARNLPGV